MSKKPPRKRQSAARPARGSASARTTGNRTTGSRTAGNRTTGGRAHTASEIRILNFLAIIPGVTMILVTARMWMLDISDSEMAKLQYTEYPEIFRFGNFIIVVCGILYAILTWIDPARKKPFLQKHPEFLFFGTFLACMLLSTLVNGLDDKAIYGLPYRNQGVFLFAAYIVIYYLISSNLNLQNLKKFVLLGFLLLADMLAVSAVAHQFFITIAAYSGKKGLSTIFFNSNHYGYFIAMALMVAVTAFIVGDRVWVRDFGFLSGLLNMFVLFLNNTFGSILAAFVTLLVVLVLALIKLPRAKWRAVAVASLVVAIPLLAGVLLNAQFDNFVVLLHDIRNILSGSSEASSAGTNRWGQWVKAVEYIRERPLLGYGCEGTSERMMEEINISNPHNEILTYALYFGVPGAVCYTLGVLWVFVRHLFSGAWKDPYALMAFAAAMTYFISSMFGVAMFYTAPFFFIMLGFCTNARKSTARRSTRKKEENTAPQTVRRTRGRRAQ